MNTVTDFPVITDEEKTYVVRRPATFVDTSTTVTVIEPVDMKALALTRFGEWRPQAAALVAKFKDVAFPVQTPKGYEEAKRALAEVRAPRYAAQNVSKASKSELAAVSKAVGAEEQAVIDALAATEAAIKAQIDAEDARRAAEKAEAERLAAEKIRLEAERKQRHEDGITTLAGYVAKAAGKTAAQIEAGIIFVEKIRIDEAHWQEYTQRALDAKSDTLMSLYEMRDASRKAEADAAELAALRAEKAARDAEFEAARQLSLRMQAEEAARVKAAADEAARIEAANAKWHAEQEAAEHEQLERERIADLTAGAPKVGDDEPVPEFGLVATPEGDRGPVERSAFAVRIVDSYLPPTAAVVPPPLSLSVGPYDPVQDTIVIEGITYSGEMFRELGFKSMIGQELRIDSRENGVLSVYRVWI